MQVKMTRVEFNIPNKRRKTGCDTSPDLYNLWSGAIMRELLVILGFITDGNNHNNVSYTAESMMTVVKERLSYRI